MLYPDFSRPPSPRSSVSTVIRAAARARQKCPEPKRAAAAFRAASRLGSFRCVTCSSGASGQATRLGQVAPGRAREGRAAAFFVSHRKPRARRAAGWAGFRRVRRRTRRFCTSSAGPNVGRPKPPRRAAPNRGRNRFDEPCGALRQHLASADRPGRCRFVQDSGQARQPPLHLTRS